MYVGDRVGVAVNPYLPGSEDPKHDLHLLLKHCGCSASSCFICHPFSQMLLAAVVQHREGELVPFARAVYFCVFICLFWLGWRDLVLCFVLFFFFPS